MIHSRFLLTLSLFVAVALAGCADTEQPETLDEPSAPVEETQPTTTILTVAEDAGLTTFRTAVAQAGLDEVLAGPGPYTVFAPSDEAFNALPEGTLERLLDPGSRDELQQIVNYHVLPRSIMSGDLSGEMSITSVEGSALTLTATDGSITVTDGQGTTATVISADHDADNGVIHVIDAVLMPGDGTEAGTDTSAAMDGENAVSE